MEYEEELPISPEDWQEINNAFARIVEDNEEGYSVEVIVSREQAREMVANWVEAMMGDPSAVSRSFMEYSQIIACLIEALKEDGVEG